MRREGVDERKPENIVQVLSLVSLLSLSAQQALRKYIELQYITQIHHYLQRDALNLLLIFEELNLIKA